MISINVTKLAKQQGSIDENPILAQWSFFSDVFPG